MTFQKDILQSKDSVKNADGCSFSAVADSAGMTLTLTEGTKTVKLVAPTSAKLTLSKKVSGDGSFTKIYKIDGLGSITIVHADDAFESVHVTETLTKGAGTCEVDF